MSYDPTAIACAVAVIFAAGFGWGKSFAERSIRKEQADLHRGRVAVSMPMREESAQKMLGLLRDLMREVEKEDPSYDNQ
ncbi:MAG: hypothetical protein GXZ05_09585 [Gammaproteobacteria bacterium]|nr:hypothetical protein [Gammaproteobacteria bacterium]